MRRISGHERFLTNDLLVVDQVIRKFNGKAGRNFEYNPRRIEAK
jgi:hypothetical protein